jgi:hypothetical protein
MLRSGVVADGPLPITAVVRPVPWWLARVWGRGTQAMTLPGVIFASHEALDRIRAGEAAVLLRHEAVHVEQWHAHGVIGFLTRYLCDYLRGRAVGLPHHAAYRAIRFEREAVDRSERW